ncbi:hypothetical protein [Crateriforma conspicua]|uniref:Uncharacterized protein n=1 Tax=Crateriforma conspicua TaxID=2527996 RepID=A0A5C5XUB9_9PLAN|nr:hypothetical protein [Crateriforma conspicua]TWT65615.1 hypothetical protein Pan14r_51620 [Crateriforma conspicua]
MFDPVIEIADDLIVTLPKIDFGRDDLVWRQVTVPELDVEQLDNRVHVLIASESNESRRDTGSRGSTVERPTIDFAVRARCRPSDLPRYRDLHGLAYQIGREILKLRLVADATPMIVRTRRLVDIERLRTESQFLTIRSAEFQARMAL